MKKSPAFFSFLILAALFMRTASAEEALTWQECIKEAQKNHPDLISAEEGVKAQLAAKGVTASSLFPQIDSSVAGSTAKASGKTTETYQYSLSGTQLVFDGSQTSDKIKQAEENIKAARYTFRFTSTEVRLKLRTAFINLLKAQESLNLTQEIFNIRRGNLELITLRHESGLEHKGALLNAEANLAEAKFGIAQAKRDVEVAQRQLLKEMGRADFSDVRAQGDFKISDAAFQKPDFVALAKNNPALQKLIAQKNAASFGIQAAKANFLPELSASASANKKGSQWPPDDDQWNAGLTLS
ncbi:MAG: TolC family protein, partial [Candidatus Omnitrophica bacterium]|nr:TolC family protein [Candidatus Omnitrophota bacterium]